MQTRLDRPRPRQKPRRRIAFLVSLIALAILTVIAVKLPARAGGPLVVGGIFGVTNQPFTWDTSSGEIQYRTDGGGLGILTNAEANARVAALFQVWEDVPTATISFNRVGRIKPAGAFSDGNVSTVSEFNAVLKSCGRVEQSPIVYDKRGRLFNSLFGPGSGVIGFAGPCALSDAGRIVSALAALNGAFRDGREGNDELTDSQFDAAFIHEFGHFFGLDHSQVNVNCTSFYACTPDDRFGLPTMFPFLIEDLEETPDVHPASTLAPDDLAWVSRLYPEANWASNYGTISGTVFFSDGITSAQGVNVIARLVDDPTTPEDESRRVAVSVVSGYLFTGNPGQSATGTNPGSIVGSRDPLFRGAFEIPLPPGTYTVEVEDIYPYAAGGSSIGPLDPPLRNPGGDEFWNEGENPRDSLADPGQITVSAGDSIAGIDIVLNGTRPRFDSFDSAWLRWLEPLAMEVRRRVAWV